jgi:hypothetical protein
VYAIFLGANASVGGALTLSTCGLTNNNTVLYVGTGCPTFSGSFNCRVGNDDAGDVAGQACASNPRASTLTFTAISRVYFVQVGAWSGASGRLVSGLSWSYVPQPATAATTRSASASRTRTRSATLSKSRTRKAKPQ